MLQSTCVHRSGLQVERIWGDSLHLTWHQQSVDEMAHACAGDVYAHNILVGESATPTLCDYGERLLVQRVPFHDERTVTYCQRRSGLYLPLTNAWSDLGSRHNFLASRDCRHIYWCNHSRTQEAWQAALLHAGASFFYEPGAVPYEGQEARAFGLFLADLLDRMDTQDEDSMASTALQGIKGACLTPLPSERPAFRRIASHCHSVLEVRA